MSLEDMYKAAQEMGMLTLALPPWQHAILERGEVKSLMAGASNQDGSFLVRDNKRKKGSYVLSVFQRGAPQHYVIQVVGGTYGIDDGPRKKSLEDLIDYYINDPTSPTRLTTAVCRPGTSMEAWLASKEATIYGGGDAPPVVPSRAGRGGSAKSVAVNLENIYGNIADTAVVPISKPVAKQAMSFKKAPRKTSIKGAAARANGGEAPDASVFADGAYKERDGFRENSVIKNFLQLQEEVDAIELEEREDEEDTDGTGIANMMAVQFENEAHLTEKLNVWWLNKMLKKIGEDKTVNNVRASIKDGVALMRILELLAGKKAPNYAKKPKMEVQLRDNWSAVVKFMRTLGIQVDNIKVKASDLGEEDEIPVGLDPVKLFQTDRREILKIFSKIMVYENKLINAR